jgi:HlyD family secretion protein
VVYEFHSVVKKYGLTKRISMQDQLRTKRIVSLFANWYVMYFLLLCFALYLLVKAIYPAYTSPYSRLYSSPAGYPALLRKLGKSIPVETVTASFRDMEKIISATGAIGHLHEVPISIEVSGIVTDIPVALGEKVLAGDVLMRLSAGSSNPSIAALDVDLHKARKLKAEQDYEREKSAYNEGLISISDLNQYKTAYEEATINYDKAEELYRNAVLSRSGKINIANDGSASKANIKDKQDIVKDKLSVGSKTDDSVEVLATTSGTVVQNDLQIGQNIIGGYNRALTIGRGLAFQAQFSQSYINDVHVGQTAELYLRAHPGRAFPVTIERIDKVVKRATVPVPGNSVLPYVFLASLKFNDEAEVEKDVVSGMNGYVLLRKVERRMAIPESAMMRYSGQQGMVLVVESDPADPEQHKVVARRVDFDVAENGWVGIRQGLTEGDIVVKNGQIALRENDLVDIQASHLEGRAVAAESAND